MVINKIIKMVKDYTNTQNIQITTLNNSRYNYSREAEVIHGNAATGEQYSLKRNIYSAVPITPEMAKLHWDEMDKEIEKLEAQYPGQVVSAISYQDIGGNQVIKFTPTTELIFPSGVPIFDEKGNQIVGKDNIRAEIERRKEEWKNWEREGKLSEHVEIHHTDDGKTVRIKFRAAPKRLHPNEVNSEIKWYINEASEKRENQLGIKNSQGLSEETSKFLVVDASNKKPRMEEKGSTIPMEVDKQENSPTEPIIKLLTDDEIKIASNNEITSLIERLSKELESRKKGETTSSSFQKLTTQEIENQISKAQKYLKNSQTSNTTTANNDDDKSYKVGGVLAVVGLVSVLAIGSVAFVKNKFSKSKKK